MQPVAVMVAFLFLLSVYSAIPEVCGVERFSHFPGFHLLNEKVNGSSRAVVFSLPM